MLQKRKKEVLKKQRKPFFLKKLNAKKELILKDAFTRVFFQEYRYLNLKTAQLVKLKRPYRSKFISKQRISLKLWQYKKKNFINEYWLQYTTLPKIQSFFEWKRRFVSAYNAIKETNSIGRPPYNQYYETYKKSKKRKEFFSLRKAVYRAYPWMNTMVFKRKLFRLNRKRHFCRERNPFDTKKFIPYKKWLRSARRRIWRGARGNKIPQQDQLIRKYVVLPYFSQYNSKSFKKKINELRKIHSFSKGNYFRGYFENRLKYMLYYLNFAPNPYFGKYLSNQSFALISNNSKPSVTKINWQKCFLEPKIKTTFFEKAINIKRIDQIEIAKNINREENSIFESKNKASIQESILTKQINFYNTLRHSTALKKGDILTVSAPFKKTNTFFFMNRLQKKVTPGCFKWNTEKTAALMIRDFQDIDFSEKHRVSRKRWNASILHLKK